MKSNKFLNWVAKNSTNIMTVASVAGVAATTIFACQATIKAKELIDAQEDKPDTKDTIKLTWKTYIPTALMGGVTIGTIVATNMVGRKQLAIVGAAYALSSEALREYQSNVVELIGEKKEKEVREKVAIKKLEKQPLSQYKVPLIETTNGDTLCYDSFSGRYFRSDIEKIKQAVNELNSQLINQDCVSLNEFYYLIGLPYIKTGEYMGWNMSNDGLLRMDYTSTLSDTGVPCLVLDYNVSTRYDYSSYS